MYKASNKNAIYKIQIDLWLVYAIAGVLTNGQF